MYLQRCMSELNVYEYMYITMSANIMYVSWQNIQYTQTHTHTQTQTHTHTHANTYI